MMRALVSGGAGYVGSFIVRHLLELGHEVTVAGRRPPPAAMFTKAVNFRPLDLGDAPVPSLFDGMDCFVHAALDHLPDRYRGGEGDDPQGFRRRNLDGSVALFRQAKASGVGTTVFLSSRAVYGVWPPGTVLAEETPPQPETLYGAVKLEAERALLGMASGRFRPIILRVTGVYGEAPGGANKWAALMADWRAGRPIEPRVATEVHGDDVAAATAMLIADGHAAGVFNVSDALVDRRDLLAIARDLFGFDHPLPERGDAAPMNEMSTAKLRKRGWRPKGDAGLAAAVRHACEERGRQG